MDYSKAKIYKTIINDVSDDIYIGATCQPLSKRMAEHRKSMKSKRDNHKKNISENARNRSGAFQDFTSGRNTL